jgi:methionyl-tRNA formyltransferase
VHNKIRAMSPKPGAYVELMHKGSLQRVKIFRSRLAKEALPYKQVQIEAQRFLIGCGDGRAIEIVELQLSGKNGFLLIFLSAACKDTLFPFHKKMSFSTLFLFF